MDLVGQQLYVRRVGNMVVNVNYIIYIHSICTATQTHDLIMQRKKFNLL